VPVALILVTNAVPFWLSRLTSSNPLNVGKSVAPVNPVT
jgi:hypothetical protein